MNEFRVLVCGGRNYGRKWNGTEWVDNQQEIDNLNRILNRSFEAATMAGKQFVLVHGGTRGADQLSHLWASMREERVTVRVYEADWKTHKRSAGPIRNRLMLTSENPQVVIAFPGGKGTADMIAIAKKAGVPVYEVN